MTGILDVPFVLSRMNYRKSDLDTGPYGASNCASCVFQYKMLKDENDDTTCTLVNVLLRELYDVEQMKSVFLINVNPEAICDAHLHRGKMNGYSPHDINRFARMYANLVPVPQYYRLDLSKKSKDYKRTCVRHKVLMSHGQSNLVDFGGVKMFLQAFYCPKGCYIFEKVGVPKDDEPTN